MASKIKLRRGTAQAWISAAPVILDAGEPGYDTTNKKIKVGDGITEWQSLPYLTGNYGFDLNDLIIPDGTSHLNAGGVGERNSVQIKTEIYKSGPDIVESSIALEAGNGGISAQVYGPWTGGADGAGGPTLVYAGVENVSGGNGPGFAGMVAIDPGVTSQYAVSVDEDGKIFISVGEPVTTTEYTAALGVLTNNIDPETGHVQLNGILVTQTQTIINGRSLIGMSTDRGTVLFGNQPEQCEPPTATSHFHIMKATEDTTDLFFGDDFNYVKLPGNNTGTDHDYGVEIGTDGSKVWRFGLDGVLNFPNNNGQIGQLEAPYTGLEFRTGSGADWIGISYGEINDNNTSYFYFDKDGEDYTTANHRAHLQIKNPAHDGHVEWLFDSAGSLTLPQGSTIEETAAPLGLAKSIDLHPANPYYENQYLRIYPTNGGDNNHLHLTSGDLYDTELYLGDDQLYVKLTNTGSVVVNASDNVSNSAQWAFDPFGNLTLPPSGDIFDSNGQSVLGTNSPTYRDDITLSMGSTLSDEELSVDLVVDRTSTSSYWYSLFGDTGATNAPNATINGSVCHDTNGNVYVLSSIFGIDNNDNLFLKYSPTGKLLWRKTWTDQDGLSCGSYNASMRFVAASTGTQDTILWAAQTPNNNISYVGTMDMEGNMVDQFGNVRLPVRLDNFAVTDLEWATDIGVPYVVVVGQLHVDGTGYNYPTFAGVDLDTAEIIGDITVVPAGTDLTAGLFSAKPWANMFKALTVLPPVGPAPSILAVVGSYYDGSHTHAMVTLSSGPETLTVGIGVDNHGSDDVIGEDICCDANGNVYVIVNNISSNYAVLVKGNAGSIESGSAIWQRRIGDLSGSDSFYATAVTYSSGHVYVLGQFYQDNIEDTDVMLIKLNEYTGNIVWSRRIHSAGDDGLNFVGAPGWESSSGIHVQDGLIVISFATEARTPGINNGPVDLNTVTLQYPVDGSLLGTFGDFEITEEGPLVNNADYSITTLTTAGDEIPFTSRFASLQATTDSVDTGWENIQWDLENNRQVYGEQTWKFNYDGSFDTKEITHLDEVKITARVAPDIIEPTPSTWAFQNNDGLRFPDGSVQYGAYVETETALDGGFASTVFNIVPRPLVADGGGSSTRFGVNDPTYDGTYGNNYVLDGGGA